MPVSRLRVNIGSHVNERGNHALRDGRGAFLFSFYSTTQITWPLLSLTQFIISKACFHSHQLSSRDSLIARHMRESKQNLFHEHIAEHPLLPSLDERGSRE